MSYLDTSDGVRLHYRVEDFRKPWETDGSEAVILHHGFARNLKWWNEWIPVLARRRPVIRFDVRGFGRSSVPTKAAQWSVDRLLEDVDELRRSLHIERLHWLGFESGALLGVYYASRRSDLLVSLSLVNMPYKYAANEAQRDFLNQGAGSATDAIRILGWEEWVRRTTPNRIDIRVASERAVAWHLGEQTANSAAAASAFLRHVAEQLDVSELIGDLSLPMLIMFGDQSLNVPWEMQNELRRRLGRPAEEYTVSGGGPGFYLLQASECASVVDDFISRCSSENPSRQSAP